MRNGLCIFCENELGIDSGRAKEHVLKKSWIEKLEHEKSPLSLAHVGPDGTVNAERALTPMGHLTGEVCRDCNNGWMRELDHQVEDIVLEAAAGIGIAVISTSSGWGPLGRVMARWIAKTAFCHMYTAPPERRFLPRDLLLKMPDPGFVPAGLFAFNFIIPVPHREIGCSQVDAWMEAYAEIAQISEGERVKFAVQYDRAIFGMGLILDRSPTFHGYHEMHTPIHLEKCSVRLQGLTQNPVTDWDLPPHFPPNNVNVPLLALGATLA